MDDNMTLKIDPETMDIPIDEDGCFELIYGDETRAQCVRLTLQAWKGSFPLDESHGTEYARILGRKRAELEDDEVEEVLREAIFQETDVEQIDALTAETDTRDIAVAFSGTLYNGQTISIEVTQK